MILHAEMIIIYVIKIAFYVYFRRAVATNLARAHDFVVLAHLLAELVEDELEGPLDGSIV